MRTHCLGPSLSFLPSQGEGAVCFLTGDAVEAPRRLCHPSKGVIIRLLNGKYGMDMDQPEWMGWRQLHSHTADCQSAPHARTIFPGPLPSSALGTSFPARGHICSCVASLIPSTGLDKSQNSVKKY